MLATLVVAEMEVPLFASCNTGRSDFFMAGGVKGSRSRGGGRSSSGRLRYSITGLSTGLNFPVGLQRDSVPFTL